MAASANPINATNYVLKISTDGGTTFNALAELQNATLSTSMETRDTTTKDSAGWRELGEGLRQWSMTGSGLVVFAPSGSMLAPDDVFTLLGNRTKVTLQFTTANTGDYEWEGDAYVTELSLEGGTEDNLTFSVTFEGTGPLTQAAVS